MRTKTARLCAAACVALGALSPAAMAQDAPSFQIRAKEIVLGDGTRVENGVLLVQNGRIARVGSAQPDPALPLVDHDGVLTAGMVACQSASGLGGEADDDTRAFLPEGRIAYAFDPDHADFEKALAAGITTMVLTPDGGNVVGGVTAVVKSHGAGVLSDEGHLALSFAGAALGKSRNQPFLFFGAAEPPTAADGGPENTDVARRGSRAPTSYPGALRMLREHFGSGQGAYARAKDGSLPVFVQAHDRHEVLRALTFAKEQGLSGALYGAPLIGDPALLTPLQESGFGVIVGPYSVGQLSPSIGAVKSLQDAGVTVAFALGAPAHDPVQMRMAAAMALSAGADPAGLWRALTADAAKLAGAQERVGTLEAGKDADLVLWSGDPLNLGSRVEAVYVDGELAYTAKKDGGTSR